MGSLLDLDLLYADLPNPLELIFDIHVWNQGFTQMNDAPRAWRVSARICTGYPVTSRGAADPHQGQLHAHLAVIDIEFMPRAAELD